MKPAPPVSPRKTGKASRTSGEGGVQPSPGVVALPTQVGRSVPPADALPGVTPFLDQPFIKDLPPAGAVPDGSPTLDSRRRGRPPAHQAADRARARAHPKPDEA